MKTYYYNKLVRDNIPAIIEESGSLYEVLRMTDVEYLEALKRKLVEEVQEYIESESIDELADILEVVRCLAITHNIDEDGLEKIRAEKELSNGSFKQKIKLVKVIKEEIEE